MRAGKCEVELTKQWTYLKYKLRQKDNCLTGEIKQTLIKQYALHAYILFVELEN